MALNYIWIAFFVIAFVVALIKLIFLGDTQIFSAMVASTFDMAKTGFEISLGFSTNCFPKFLKITLLTAQ